MTVGNGHFVNGLIYYTTQIFAAWPHKEMAIWKCILGTSLEMMFSNIAVPSPKM